MSHDVKKPDPLTADPAISPEMEASRVTSMIEDASRIAEEILERYLGCELFPASSEYGTTIFVDEDGAVVAEMYDDGSVCVFDLDEIYYLEDLEEGLCCQEEEPQWSVDDLFKPEDDEPIWQSSDSAQHENSVKKFADEPPLVPDPAVIDNTKGVEVETLGDVIKNDSDKSIADGSASGPGSGAVDPFAGDGLAEAGMTSAAPEASVAGEIPMPDALPSSDSQPVPLVDTSDAVASHDAAADAKPAPKAQAAQGASSGADHASKSADKASDAFAASAASAFAAEDGGDSREKVEIGAFLAAASAPEESDGEFKSSSHDGESHAASTAFDAWASHHNGVKSDGVELASGGSASPSHGFGGAKISDPFSAGSAAMVHDGNFDGHAIVLEQAPFGGLPPFFPDASVNMALAQNDVTRLDIAPAHHKDGHGDRQDEGGKQDDGKGQNHDDGADEDADSSVVGIA